MGSQFSHSIKLVWNYMIAPLKRQDKLIYTKVLMTDSSLIS